MVLSSSTKTHDEIIKKFLNIEKITMNDLAMDIVFKCFMGRSTIRFIFNAGAN